MMEGEDMFRIHLFPWMAIGLFAVAGGARAQSFVPRSGSELVANAFNLGDQSRPALAVRADDAFVAAWVEGGTSTRGIKARLFDAAGAPSSPEIWVDQSDIPSDGPRIGCAVDGSFAVAWSDGQDVWVRRFGRDGGPLGDKLRVNDLGLRSSLPDLAMAPGGAFVVAWRQDGPGGNGVVLAARFDNQGGRNGTLQVSSGSQTPILSPRLAIAVDGGFVAAWETANQILARRFGPLGAIAPPVRLDDPQTDQGVVLAPPLLRSDGTATVIWISNRGLLGRRLDAAGAVAGDVTLISPSAPAAPLAVAADPAGNALVLGGQNRVLGLLFDRALVRRSDLFQVGGPPYTPASEPALVARYAGGFVALWTSGFVPSYGDLRPSVEGTDGNALGVAGQLFGPVRCAPGSDVLCLGPGGRFEARLDWKTPDPGDTGAGHPLHLTPDTGAFWFFSADNLELMVKVVDATSLNGHFWIYTGALSNVEYTLTVTDTVAGTERVYHNPPFRFGNVGDVNAFAATPDFLAPQEIPVALSPPAQITGCPPVSSNLCLDGGHFAVAVDFNDPRTGLTMGGRAVPLTADTGAFWFFNDRNLELMVKILDGRTINGKFWVFYGALSDVDYTIHVRNTFTGVIKDYHNPRGTLASRADIQAF